MSVDEVSKHSAANLLLSDRSGVPLFDQSIRDWVRDHYAAIIGIAAAMMVGTVWKCAEITYYVLDISPHEAGFSAADTARVAAVALALIIPTSMTGIAFIAVAAYGVRVGVRRVLTAVNPQYRPTPRTNLGVFLALVLLILVVTYQWSVIPGYARFNNGWLIQAQWSTILAIICAGGSLVYSLRGTTRSWSNWLTIAGLALSFAGLVTSLLALSLTAGLHLRSQGSELPASVSPLYPLSRLGRCVQVTLANGQTVDGMYLLGQADGRVAFWDFNQDKSVSRSSDEVKDLVSSRACSRFP